MKLLWVICLVGFVLVSGCTILEQVSPEQIIKNITVKELDNMNVVSCGRSSATAYYVIDTENNLYSIGQKCRISTEPYMIFKSLKVNNTYKISYYKETYSGTNIIDGIEWK